MKTGGFPTSGAKIRSTRQLAIKAVLNGQKQVELAKIFGVSRNTIGRWVKAYRDGGISVLARQTQGQTERGRPVAMAGGANCQNSGGSPP